MPADAPELEPYLGRSDIEIRTFDRHAVERERSRVVVPARAPARSASTLPFTARHMAENTLAALVAYEALGLPLDRAQAGADAIMLSRWRGEELPLPGGGFVVNDAYNANPTSMRAALLDLVARADGRRRVAILGEMAELGESAERLPRGDRGAPRRARDRARRRDRRGRGRYRAGGGDSPTRRWIPDAEAFDRVADCLQPGDAILVKASRAVGLEGIPASIEKRARAWSES